MKILFFINKLYGGGAERVASILLNHLCEKHDTYVAITDFKYTSYPIDSRVHIIDNSIKCRIKGGYRFLWFAKMVNSISRVNPDIIISFTMKCNNRSLLANLLFRKKIIISERITLKKKNYRKQRLFRLLYRLANKIVFVSADDCKDFGLPQKSITIYNPAMFEPYCNYNNRQKTIITIAPDNRWYQKGLDILISAWNRIAQQNPNWNLEIYGNIYGTPLPNIITQQKQERIAWKGWDNNIADVLRTKSIFILASRHEGCPNSLIEAMSQGCVCLGTDCGGSMKEMITDGVDGLIVKSENVDDIAEKLQMLIDDEQLRRHLSAGAIEKAKQFDKNVFFASWDKLIEEVAEK